MKKYLLFLIIIFLTSCYGDAIRIDLVSNGLQFYAIANKYEGEVEGGHKITGKLKIINSSESAVSYSNKDLYLVIRGEGESRTYVNSIASTAIDFTAVNIEKGNSFEQNVYWVLPPVKSLKAEKLFLEWRSN